MPLQIHDAFNNVVWTQISLCNLSLWYNNVMFTSRKDIAKSSRSLASSVFAPSLRNGYLPRIIDLDSIKKSPAFHSPQKWISKLKFIDDSERIQSYKTLEQSCIAQILSSPPRMTHATRTVVPRDLLIPFRVMRNPMISESTENVVGGKNKYEYIMTPFHPSEKKLPEDPVAYYPRNISLLEEYPDSFQEETAMLRKYSLNTNLYPNIKDWKSVGWNINTAKVVNKISSDQVEKLLSGIFTTFPDARSKILLSEGDEDELIFLKNDFVAINLSRLAKHNQKIKCQLAEKFPLGFIPINDKSLRMIKELIAYCILMNGRF
ncbi:hypothetical protein PICMEDRAFT_136171 [Pichia membranifaciens NRRL Y-2026]|uniref:Required for respiratory growth protein 8, mitochondrial n=1 Tax=Pichia membranifaciens NRRL Y-2026 TaxID=763406 RepID=A0A1E3NMY4_9ASCO|nr:hypothetical protein PICMEDRAFT_136171 [Pichia membranifaciens NRRL Y-2026]ODQ46753.1 hypothetical protein PICMEDRAFT_136171 [Pichia membranifaciens NRRL Y-2026]